MMHAQRLKIGIATLIAITIISAFVGYMILIFDIAVFSLIALSSTLFGIILFQYLKNKSFPNLIHIIQIRGNHHIQLEDRAKRVVLKDGTEVYELFKRGRQIKPPAFKDMTTGENGSNHIYLCELDNRNFVPISFDYFDKQLSGTDKDVPKIKIVAQEDLHFYVKQLKRAAEEREGEKSILSQYLPVLIIMATGLSIMGILYLTLPVMQNLATDLGQTAKEISAQQGAYISYLQNVTVNILEPLQEQAGGVIQPY